ncbi:MAG: flotillin-like FloA family protein [Alistipes sp.]|nr:flotillin-like FloA family protein [Alistipes sp.]
MELGVIIMLAVLALIAIWVIFYFVPVGLWFTALISGAHISLLQMVLMRWRKIPVSAIVSSMIEGTKAGLKLNPNSLEAHYLAGGNFRNVVHALVSAQKAGINLTFEEATAIDLAGRDVFELFLCLFYFYNPIFHKYNFKFFRNFISYYFSLIITS